MSTRFTLLRKIVWVSRVHFAGTYEAQIFVYNKETRFFSTGQDVDEVLLTAREA